MVTIMQRNIGPWRGARAGNKGDVGRGEESAPGKGASQFEVTAPAFPLHEPRFSPSRLHSPLATGATPRRPPRPSAHALLLLWRLQPEELPQRQVPSQLLLSKPRAEMVKLRHRGRHAASEVHRGCVAEQGFEPRTPESQPLITRHRSLLSATALKACLIHWLYLPILFIGKVQSAPDVVAHFRGDVTLRCLFLSQPGMNLQHLILTWQKEQVGAEALVVHSYYYGRDQLEKQDKAYRNRTQLEPEGLARGNASLTLRDIHLQDEGVYQCHITSELGTMSELWELRVGALFSEPQLTFSLSSAGVMLTVHTWGGYPAATVQWLDEAGRDVTAEGATEQQVDEQGLYHITSWVTVPPVTHSTRLTFVLTPRVLGAPITRPLSLQLSPGLLSPPASCLGVHLAVICAACLFIVLLAVAFLYHLHQGPAGSRSWRKAEKIEEEQKEISCPISASPSSEQACPTGHEQPAGAKP
ncbi:CD276 antigen-like isoform X1 [Dermochelys coriacea]|uniref:CD276 antigen-like isoform X1 n=1 Tax=Dermochelys coriacea TaxID=27794 RepID=UPI0018E8C12E|nr:CD276 antigen-like isoform X1 [Dermochelys coriacea]